MLAFIQSLDIKAISTEVMYKLFAMLEMKYDFKLSNERRNGGNEDEETNYSVSCSALCMVLCLAADHGICRERVRKNRLFAAVKRPARRTT